MVDRVRWVCYGTHMAITQDTPTLATRLEDDDRLWLEQKARENERSVAAELRYLVKRYRREENGENT